MGYSYIVTSDASFLTTVDGAAIVINAPDVAGGCPVPLAGAARIGEPPPPNPVSPAQFSPGGLLAIPLTLLEQLPDRIPQPPVDAPTAYVPLQRLEIVEAVLAAMLYPPGTTGCQAYAAAQAVAAALRASYADAAGYLRWEFPDPPEPAGHHTCVRPDGTRVWSSIVVYPDGAFYWILGGLGGYGLEPYWVFGGFADPALFVYP